MPAEANLPLERVERTRPLRQQIYDIVRRRILTGELAPGMAIDEKAIAVKLGVSRTPVREAVKKLSDESSRRREGAIAHGRFEDRSQAYS